MILIGVVYAATTSHLHWESEDWGSVLSSAPEVLEEETSEGMVLESSTAMPVATRNEMGDTDTVLHFPLPRYQDEPNSPLYLNTPSNITTTVEYDPNTHDYVKVTKVGNMILSREYMTFSEYQEWRTEQVMNEYWNDKTKISTLNNSEGGLLSNIPGFNEVSRKLEAIMGKPKIELNPTGSVDLTFQFINNRNENPSMDTRSRNMTTFDFDENIQINLNAKIGDIFNVDFNWNTKATFDFENKIKLRYDGKEDDILQLIELADISYPLNTTLIKGSQQLFGVHSKLKFGKFLVDAVVSQKNTSTENLQVQGGASTHEFEIGVDDYEENRHYFISQYFYENYNKAMSTLPVVNSNIKIIRLEVWRTNIGAAITNNRDILALSDLGEYNPVSPGVVGGISKLPSTTQSNNILQVVNPSAVRSSDAISGYMQGLGFHAGTDFEKIQSARLLNSNEYTFNSQLGFITLSQPLSSDQVLAVAFQYQVIGDTTVYQVGELTTDGINDPNVLIVKLLKGSAVNTGHPLWRLMMKNIYFLKSTQLTKDNFRLNILHENPEGGVGIGYFTEGPLQGTPLVEVFGLDRMDASQNYYYADGVFDWFDSAAFKGGTIQASTGRIYFPFVEPFGKDLREMLGNGEFANKYCFDSLYTMTKALAQQYADKNKFYLEGYYTSSVSGEISLGYSVTQGSVTVTAGGMPLIENVDYTVDYTMGTVRIINESILSSGTPISVSCENNSFNMTTKNMFGLHLNYEFEPDFNLGATVMNLTERPLTQKNNFGEEPTSNSIWGLDLNYRHEAPFITKLVDKLPGIQTKAPSNLTLQAEIAQFVPGLTNTGNKEGSVSYVDDFEGAEANIDLKTISSWHLASTPQDYSTSLPLFPETAPGTDRAYGFNRALLSWYRIDNNFYSTSSSSRNRPENITDDDISKPYSRSIGQVEVFPNKSLVAGDRNAIYELNLAYYPSERGPYNYDVNPSPFSAGLGVDGLLNNPASRWGGIMRDLTYTDFESKNIETLEFWLMDPFMDPETGEHDDNLHGGDFYINLGDISEDILRDGKKSFENGLPTRTTISGVDTTIWGRVPVAQSIVNAFDNDESTRKYQDVGLDGLGSTNGLEDEREFFADYLTEIALLHGTSSQAYATAYEDPSSDNFVYWRDPNYDANDAKILERYKYYSNLEGNSTPPTGNTFANSSTIYPDIEDINKDNTLSEAENYYEYVIHLDPSQMNIGENYIVDIHNAENIQLPNGSTTSCKWYQFRIPIREPDRVVGNIKGFQSIRFMRMFLRNFEDPVVLRFATLELVYGTWRKYTEDLLQPGDYSTGSNENTTFTMSTVNIEENGSRAPVPYNLPPDIEREEWQSSTSAYTVLNEQSLSLDIGNLASGDARAIYRNLSYDLRYYGKLKMFVHAEKKLQNEALYDDDIVLFVRLGSDYTSNYYEYEVPLKLTPWGTSFESKDIIWPKANNVEIDLQALVDLKTNRNKRIRNGEMDYSNNLLYSEYINGRKCTVLGTPNLGKVKVIMIGVRNPKKESLTDDNDMMPKSIIVWINELRLAEYKNRGGFSAMALARTNLADIGNFSIYSAYTSSGFGNLEDNINKLELVNNFNTQMTLNLEVGKFFPEDWAVRIPLYVDFNNEVGRPEYNPLDPDVELRTDLRTYATQAERDSVKAMTLQRKATTNLTLTNMHKERIGKSALKPHFYDVENFNFSYAYSNERSSNDDLDHFNKDMHRGGFTYNYSIMQPKQYKPFEKMKSISKNKNLKFIKDFNLYYQPKNVSFSTELFRDVEETLLRNKSAAMVILRPSQFKQFTWKREYGLNYDVARSLRVQYSANANARIDEPVGLVDNRTVSDSIWQSILDGGTMQNFRQSINASWDFPISKLPYMDFVRMPITYRTLYDYQGTTQALASQGSIIQSSNTFNAALTANMQTLYNKFKLIKKAYAPKPPKKKTSKDWKDADKDKNKLDAKRGMTSPLEDNAKADSIRKAEMMAHLREIGFWGLRFVTMVKDMNVQFNYSNSARISGFMGEATIMGMDPRGNWNPGPGFVFGYNTDVVDDLLRNDLLSHDTLMNIPHQNSTNRILSIQANIEPIRDFKIAITCNENFSQNEQYYFKYNTLEEIVDGPLSYTMVGSYTSTAWTFRSAFKNPNLLYETFLANRAVVADRLAAINPDPYTNGWVMDTNLNQLFPAGYSANSQTVLLTSFLATYLGEDPHSMGFSPFLKMPLPNWNINYNGLNKIQWLKKWFTNITISHKYSSTYTIGNFYTDAAISGHEGYDYGHEDVLNNTGDFISPLSMEGVQISEQFNPLIRATVAMVNSFQFNLSVQKNRTLALSFSNNQLTETSRLGFTMGTGYRFKDVELHIKTAEKTHDFKSDLVLQLNITYNDNKTEIRRINQNVSQISSGSKVWMAEISAEYALMSYLTVRAFFQTNINKPYISFMNATTKGGITLRLSF